MMRRIHALAVAVMASAWSCAAEEPSFAGDLALAWDGITNYACTITAFNRLGAKSERKQVRFAYRRPGVVSMEALDGPDRGGALARDERGVIRGRKGGILKLIAVTLADDDPRVSNLRGGRFYRADWGSIIGEIRGRVRSGWTVKAVGDDACGGVACSVYELNAPPGSAGVTRDCVWVEHSRRVILRRQQHEGGMLVNDVTWRDIEINQPVDESSFSL